MSARVALLPLGLLGTVRGDADVVGGCDPTSLRGPYVLEQESANNFCKGQRVNVLDFGAHTSLSHINFFFLLVFVLVSVVLVVIVEVVVVGGGW